MGRGRGASQGGIIKNFLRKEVNDGVEAKPMRSNNSLMPLGVEYMSKGFNVLLISKHGIGKTSVVLDTAKQLEYNVQMFSCATMDPYTDLIGVPVPKTDEEGDHLQMVRPRNLMDAEVIFFDEINRGSLATQNAVFEIIQFGTINGEPLPNLKCCWAAMNPDDGDYNVEVLDPALVDRFDAYQELNPSPSVEYMSKKMSKPVAQALVSWWKDQNREKRGPESYISPRRLEKIGIVFEAIGKTAIKQTLPPGGTYDSGKLVAMLEAAQSGKPIKDPSKLRVGNSTGGSTSIRSVQNKVKSGKKIPAKEMLQKKEPLIKHFKDNPGDIEIQKHVMESLGKGINPEDLVDDYGELILAMKPAVVESWRLNSFIRKQPSSYKSKRLKQYLNQGKPAQHTFAYNDGSWMRYKNKKCALKAA